MVENSDFINVYKTKKESLPPPLLKMKQVKKTAKVFNDRANNC